MAKRRQLKKNINVICSELFAECIATSLYNESANKENANSLLKVIMRLQSDYIARISHTEPNESKTYYRHLIHKFNESVDEIIDQISNLQ
jgi:hypothetical protein